MRVLVCGGRGYGEMPKDLHRMSPEWDEHEQRAAAEIAFLNDTLDRLQPRPTIIIHGGQNGADSHADRWARRQHIATLRIPVDWYPNGRAAGMDKSAGPRRNQRLLDEGNPGLVIAFPGGRGTADMMTKAKAAGVEVRQVGREPAHGLRLLRPGELARAGQGED